jgi:membrane dipeptidase
MNTDPRPLPVWDCHTDVLSQLLTEPCSTFVSGRLDMKRGHYDLDRLTRGGVAVMVCALFCHDSSSHEHPVTRTLRQIDNAHQVERLTEGRVAIARSAAEIDRIVADGRTALVLSIENGVPLLDRLELLRTFHRLGVRAMGLTWNGRNTIADGCGVESAASKLTPFGREVVQAMNELRMVIDVSHLSETCFWDLLEVTEGVIIASHSNARPLRDHARNLRDEQVRAIAARGGVVGLNYWSDFLTDQNKDKDGWPHASLADIVRHALYLLEVAGGDHVGIGADYDGIGFSPEGAEDPAAFPALADALRQEGVSEAVVRKVFYDNFHRVFRDVVG